MNRLKMTTLLLITAICLVSARPRWVLFMVGGQSNAMGSCGPTNDTVSCTPRTAYEFDFNNNRLVHLSDPVGLPGLEFGRAFQGSAWPALARRYHELTGDTVVIVPTSRNASAMVPKADFCCGSWTGPHGIFDRAKTKIDRAIQLTGIQLTAIVWIQGETDAIGINDRKITHTEYEDSLKSLIRRFRSTYGPSLPFFMVRIGTDVTRADSGFKQIRDAQERVALQDSLTILAYRRTMEFPALRWMADGIHYSMAGLNDIGRSVADTIAVFRSGRSTSISRYPHRRSGLSLWSRGNNLLSFDHRGRRVAGNHPQGAGVYLEVTPDGRAVSRFRMAGRKIHPER